jgi:hypothetical protein
MVVGQEMCAELLGEGDVERVGCRHVVSVRPSGIEQWRDRRSVQMPVPEPGYRQGCLRLAQRPVYDRPAAEDGQHLGVEVLGHPALGVGWDQTGQRPTTERVRNYLRAGRRVDDNRCHSLQSALSSRRASAAAISSTPVSGVPSSDSMKALKAAGEQSSSRLVSTTLGPDGISDT